MFCEGRNVFGSLKAFLDVVQHLLSASEHSFIAMSTSWQQLAVSQDLEGHGVYLWLAGSEGMEKNVEAIVMGFIGTTIRIQAIIHG